MTRTLTDRDYRDIERMARAVTTPVERLALQIATIKKVPVDAVARVIREARA